MSYDGTRWSALGLPATEPWQPPGDRHRPTGWPKTGSVGATTQLRDDEHPAAVPGRPYADVRRNAGQHPDRLGQLLRDGTWSAPRARRWFARAIGWFRR